MIRGKAYMGIYIDTNKNVWFLNEFSKDTQCGLNADRFYTSN